VTWCRHRQELSRLEGELDSLRERYSSASEELVSTNNDRVRLTEQVDQLRQQLQKASDEKNATQRTTMKQVYFCSLSFSYCLILSHGGLTLLL